MNEPRRLWQALVITLAVCVGHGWADIIYVDAAAPGSGDGLTWQTAFRYLQDGLAAAQAGDEIRIAGGAYYPDLSDTGQAVNDDRDAVFVLIEQVTVTGGYAGSNDPNAPDTHDPNAFQTILSGDLQGNDLPDFASRDDNAYTVVYAPPDITGLTFLNDVTIQGGYADGSGALPRYTGGGLLVAGDLRLVNCRVRDNHSRYIGGAVYVSGGTPFFYDSVFENNRALATDGSGWGGAILTFGSKLTVIGCTFTGNMAGSSGGAIYLGEPATVAECDFAVNTARWGGAIEGFGAAAILYVEDTTFSENTAEYKGTSLGGGAGGAIDFNEGFVSIEGSAFIGNQASAGGGVSVSNGTEFRITDCSFTQNVVTTGWDLSGWGAAVGSWEARGLIERCIISTNSASRLGGGVWHGGDTGTRQADAASAAPSMAQPVVDLEPEVSRAKAPSRATSGPAELLLRNSVVYGNVAQYGAGVESQALPIQVVHATLAGNQATVRGGGLRITQGAVSNVINTIISANTAGTGAAYTVESGATLSLGHSIVTGGQSSGYVASGSTLNWLAGMLTGTPTFVDLANGDLHLAGGSIGIDAGDPAAVPGDVVADLDKRLREWGLPDMGAYEYGSPGIAQAGDMDADGVLDVVDNCPLTWNEDNADSDGDGIGDACDDCTGTDTVVYVKWDATGAADGSSWADAYTDLADALAGPACSQIWIAAGEYVAPSGGFVLPGSLTLLGGFAGFETSVAMRDIELNEVVLSADVNGDDDYGSLTTWRSTIADNRPTILSGLDVLSHSVIDGITFVGATYAACDFDNVIVSCANCTFHHNSCNAIDAAGAAFRIVNGSAVAIRFCDLYENRVGYAGSAAIHAADSTLLIVAEIYDSVFDTPVVNQGEAVSVSGGRLGLANTFIIDNYRDETENEPLGLWLDQVGEFLVHSSSITGLMGTINGSTRIDGFLGLNLRVAPQRGQRALTFGGHSEIRGCGVVIDPDAELHLADYATMRQQHRGWVGADGRVVVEDEATLEDTFVAVAFSFFPDSVFDEDDPADVIDCVPDTQLSVTVDATVQNNYIYSVDDRYLDFDVPGSATGSLRGNRIFVSMPARLNDAHGLLLEARGIDADCNDPLNCPSGAFDLASVPPPTEDSWTLERLIVPAYGRLNIVNRFDYQDPLVTGGLPEAVYVDELWIGPDAVLNTGLNRLYYQSLLDDTGQPLDPPDTNGYLTNGARFIDVPLQGFSLVNIDMENECEYLLRVETDDEGGPITKIDGALRMETDDRDYAEAYAAFGKADADEIVKIAFLYRFLPSAAGASLEVYVSGEPLPDWGPDRAPEYTTIATITPPSAGRPGAPGSSEYAVFDMNAAIDSSQFTRGLYIGLRLEGTGVGVEIDDWDPQIECSLTCLDLSGDLNVTTEDLLLHLAETGSSVAVGKGCLDAPFAKNSYVDLDDILALDAVLSADPLPTNYCEPPLATGDPNGPVDPLALPAAGLIVAGKPTGGGRALPEDRLFGFDPNGEAIATELLPASGGPYHGNGRLIKRADGAIFQLHATKGLIALHTATLEIAPFSQDVNGQMVYVGVLPTNDIWGYDLDGYPQGLPLLDVAFDPNDPNVAYVVPVVVESTQSYPYPPPFDDPYPYYKAAAQLTRQGGGSYQITQIYGVEPALDDCTNTVPPEASACRVQGQCEIELDGAGHVLVLSTSNQSAANDWLAIYDAVSGAEQHRIVLTDVAAGLANPTTLLASRHTTNRVYLTSELDVDPNDGQITVYGCTLDVGGPTPLSIAGEIAVDCAGVQPTGHGYGHLLLATELMENPNDGTLHVIGLASARVAAELSQSDPLYQSLFCDTCPLASTSWHAMIPTGGSGPVTATALTGHDLGLPLSAALFIAGDITGDDLITIDDLAAFEDCMNGPDVPSTCDPLIRFRADADRDSDVDLADFAKLQ